MATHNKLRTINTRAGYSRHFSHHKESICTKNPLKGNPSPPPNQYEPISDEQIQCTIAKMSPFNATGPNGLSNAVLTHCADLLTPYLGCLYHTIFCLNTYPQQWKTSITAVLQKPNKPNYSVVKAYRPITLMETLTKPLSGCVVESLSYQAEKHNLLPNTNFGGVIQVEVPQMLFT